MRSVADWLSENGKSHQNRTNELLHWICVPPIVLALLGVLWCVPVPPAFAALSPWLNWATLAAAAALIYSVFLSPSHEVGVVVAFIALLTIIRAPAHLPWPLWASSLAIFLV